MSGRAPCVAYRGDVLEHDEPLIYYGQFLHAPGWQGNEATIAVVPGSAFEDLIGPSITSSANGPPVTVRMVVFRGPHPADGAWPTPGRGSTIRP